MTSAELMELWARARRAESALRLHPDDTTLAKRAEAARLEYEDGRRAWLQREAQHG